MRTFKQRYCSAHGLPAADFERVLLRQCLYPHARALRVLLELFAPDFFGIDLEFIRAAGAVRTRRELMTEMAGFRHHPANAGFARATLRLRVSAQKVWQRLEHQAEEMAPAGPACLAS